MNNVKKILVFIESISLIEDTNNYNII